MDRLPTKVSLPGLDARPAWSALVLLLAVLAVTAGSFCLFRAPNGREPVDEPDVRPFVTRVPTTVEGIVLSHEGSGLAGAEVYLLHSLPPDADELVAILARNDGRMPWPRVAARGTTSAGGLFHLASPITERAVRFELHVKAPGHAVHRQGLVLVPSYETKLPPIHLEGGRKLSSCSAWRQAGTSSGSSTRSSAVSTARGSPSKTARSSIQARLGSIGASSSRVRSSIPMADRR